MSTLPSIPASNLNGGHLAAGIGAISLLDDPVRRKVYFSVPPPPSHADRDRVASEVGISRNLAAFHLDKLAEQSLLDVTYRRVSGRTGRGAGRPRKLYQRSQEDKVAISLPQRDYGLIARLLVAALEAGGAQSRAKLAAVAHERGLQLGKSMIGSAGSTTSRRRRLSVALDMLVNHGYDPYVEGKAIFMRNCPFHALTKDHREVVCGANQAFMAGFAEILESVGLRAAYEPAQNRCCVVFRPTAAAF